ncbi:MAG: hypothetical protein COX07_07460 [Bacteroidetes bacterium CG23_combo_of_CG06-09_8_20_14_all_32_9]|nr:MAG: hypothetical protein COX07_07460 [Bacteroidetes bacterium CG23_combo_of_CG06-09_8_20_14_all_32_9]
MFVLLLKKCELYGMQQNIKIDCINNVHKFVFLFIALLITVLMLIFSCRKEKKNDPPVISVYFPLPDIALNAIDSVRVIATISDDSGPLIVSIYIANEQMQAFTTSLVKSFSGNELNVDEFYFFNNKYFESGFYYLVIHADDGKNVVNKFIKVYITGITRILQSVYVGVEDVLGVKIFCSNSSGNFNQVGIISSNIISACINNYSQQIYFLLSNGDFLCYLLPDFQKEWQKNGFSAPGHIFKGETKEYKYFTYVTDANGFVYGFDNSGIVRKVISVTDGAPFRFNFCNSLLITAVEDDVSQNNSLQAITLNGGLICKYQVNFFPSAFLPYAANTVLVWGESQNQVQIYTYNTEINYLYTFGNPIQGNFNAAIETPDNKYLVSVGNEMNVIEKNYGSATIFADGKRADLIKFEDISQTIYATDSNNLTIYNYPSPAVVYTYSFTGKVLFFDFLYNK